jgi:hypothetical protein
MDVTRRRWGWRIFAAGLLLVIAAALTGSQLLWRAAWTLFGLSIAAFTIDGVRTGHLEATGGRRHVRQRSPRLYWFLVALYFCFGMFLAIAGSLP